MTSSSTGRLSSAAIVANSGGLHLDDTHLSEGRSHRRPGAAVERTPSYLVDSRRTPPNDASSSARRACTGDEIKTALKKFQHKYELNETGLLDDKTRSLMSLSRCGNTDELPLLTTTANADDDDDAAAGQDSASAGGSADDLHLADDDDDDDDSFQRRIERHRRQRRSVDAVIGAGGALASNSSTAATVVHGLNSIDTAIFTEI